MALYRWHSQQSHYIEAIDFLIESELATSDFNVAVFSDDLEFVEAHVSDYGLDRVTGEVRLIRGNDHFNAEMAGGSYMSSKLLADFLTFTNLIYALTTSSGWPRSISLPWSSQIASLHISLMLPSPWLTKNMARALSRSSAIFAFAFSRKCASPVDSASSIIKMSGFMWTATENPTRADMPEE